MSNKVKGIVIYILGVIVGILAFTVFVRLL